MQASLPFEVPCVINGKAVKSGDIGSQPMPHDHATNLCTYHNATPEMVSDAIEGALAAKQSWEDMPWADRAAIFLKAADLVSGKYRYDIMAATMLGQGKNAWQAEIDAAAEVRRVFQKPRVQRLTPVRSSPTSSDSASSTSRSCTSSSPRATRPMSGSESVSLPGRCLAD